jgi:hypothetical protein
MWPVLSGKCPWPLVCQGESHREDASPVTTSVAQVIIFPLSVARGEVTIFPVLAAAMADAVIPVPQARVSSSTPRSYVLTWSLLSTTVAKLTLTPAGA